MSVVNFADSRIVARMLKKKQEIVDYFDAWIYASHPLKPNITWRRLIISSWHTEDHRNCFLTTRVSFTIVWDPECDTLSTELYEGYDLIIDCLQTKIKSEILGKNVNQWALECDWFCFYNVERTGNIINDRYIGDSICMQFDYFFTFKKYQEFTF